MLLLSTDVLLFLLISCKKNPKPQKYVLYVKLMLLVFSIYAEENPRA